jgi:O-antigen/teichoic acid export membrane protein
MGHAGRRSTISEVESHGAFDGPKTATSLLSGTSVLLASRLVVGALGWVGTLLIARRLSDVAFGAFAFIFNLLGLLGLLADFQTSRIVVREVIDAGDDLDSVVGSFVTFRVVLGALTYAIAVAIVVLGNYPTVVVQGTLIGGLSFFVASATWALVTVSQARLWLRTVAISMVVAQAVQLAAIIALFVSHNDSLLRFVVPFVVYDVVTLVWMVIAVRRVVRVRPRLDGARWWRWLKEAAPLAVGSTLGTIYFRIDGVMLSKLGDGGEAGRLRAVGLYQIGYKFSDLLAFMAPALLGAVLPLLIRAYPDRVADFRKTFRQAFVIFFAFGVFAAVTFAVLCRPVIHTLFQPRYAGAVRPARLLIVGQSINLFTQLAFVSLVASGRRKIYPIATLCGVVVNVALNFALIPRYSATGAGVATIVTEVIVLGILGYAVRDLPIRPLPWRPVAVVVLSGAVLAAAILVLQPFVPWPVALIAALAIYPGLLHVLHLDGPGGIVAFVRATRFQDVNAQE